MAHEHLMSALRARLRWWARGCGIGLANNPLLRRSDRIEARLATALLVMVILAVPLAMVLGSSVAEGQLQRARQVAAQREPTTARILDQAPIGGSAAWSGMVTVRAEWEAPDGSRRVGDITVSPATAVGAEQQISMDSEGRMVPAPLSGQEARTAGALTGIAALFGAAGGAFLLRRGVRAMLDRSRFAAWEREWRQVESH